MGYNPDMTHKPEVVAGIAWFRASQWQLLRSLATDADDLEETHEEWVKIAEKRLKISRDRVSSRKRSMSM